MWVNTNFTTAQAVPDDALHPGDCSRMIKGPHVGQSPTYGNTEIRKHADFKLLAPK
jgi:hypothetical protein